MRSSSILALALSVLGVAGAAVGSQQAQPTCVTKCWANSQYVSNCAGDRKCLCDDADFQNAMYQCLYSQCQTAQFGLALHHALALCSDDSPASTSTVPAILRQGGDLRKRGYNTQSQSNSVAYTRHSSRTMTVETITFTATDKVSQPVVTYTGVTTSASSVISYTTVSTPEPSSHTYTATFTTTLYATTSAGSSLSYQSQPTSTKTRGSQSVSASNYQTYTMSRAYPKGSQVPYSVLTILPSAVTVSNSVSSVASTSSSTPVVVLSSAVSSASVVSYTSTIVVSAVPSTSTAAVSSESTSSEASTSTKTIIVSQQVTATITASASTTATASATPTSYLEARQAWDNQRYPSDQQ